MPVSGGADLQPIKNNSLWGNLWTGLAGGKIINQKNKHMGAQIARGASVRGGGNYIVWSSLVGRRRSKPFPKAICQGRQAGEGKTWGQEKEDRGRKGSKRERRGGGGQKCEKEARKNQRHEIGKGENQEIRPRGPQKHYIRTSIVVQTRNLSGGEVIKHPGESGTKFGPRIKRGKFWEW